MPKKTPNPFQKLVRGVIRDLINQANSEKVKKRKKPNTKKSDTIKSQSTSKQEKNQRSRYIPQSVRVSVFHRDGYKCVFCGRNAQQVQLEVDHIIPFSQKGSNKIDNLQTLCIDCNRGKGARFLNKTNE